LLVASDYSLTFSLAHYLEIAPQVVLGLIRDLMPVAARNKPQWMTPRGSRTGLASDM